MNAHISIPPATRAKLDQSHPVGTRHKAALDIAISLIGNGLAPDAVFAQLRSKFPADVADIELENIVRFAVSKNPTPTVGRSNNGGNGKWTPAHSHRSVVDEMCKRPPLEHAQWWLGGATMTAGEFLELSQLKVPPTPKESLLTALEMLWNGPECLNIVCKYLEEGGKARPVGAGQILTRDKWLEWVSTNGVPESNAGAWVRPNPCSPQGSGRDGAVMDSDIAVHRYLLLESDTLPIEVQFALFSKLRLPIAAVISSGGLSVHAWVKVEATNGADFAEKARRILAALEPFGIDPCNKNPSRLSRLPGALRKIGAKNEGLQKLFWINPGQAAITTEDLKTFEQTLEVPAVDEKPFKKVVTDSLQRYEHLFNNQGKLGVPTGIPAFDKDSGGLKGGQMTVIAAPTNHGKSTVAINIINAALRAGHGVVLFTLEMMAEEIADMIFSINCRVNRNHFNTGAFTEHEMASMVGEVGKLAPLPFWIYDESTLTTASIRKRVLRLCSEKRIGLVVVDYAQIVWAQDMRAPREQQVAAIARDLSSLAKDSRLPMIVLSQLNDEGRIRESRVIAHEAHNVIVLENKELDNPPTITLSVHKGRRIPKNNYKLIYQPEYCTVSGAPLISQEDVPAPKKLSTTNRYQPPYPQD